MNLTYLSIVTLMFAITLFVVSLLARRTTNPNSKLLLITNVLRVVVLGLVAIYFFIRFTG